MATKAQMDKLSEAKKPRLKKNYVGIELEFLIPNKNIKAFKDALIEHDLETKVNLGTDSSVEEEDDDVWAKIDNWGGILNPEDQPEGGELRILAAEDEVTSVINDVCLLLREFGCYTNKTCGLHVHLDMRNRDAQKCYNNLFYMQDIMFKTQSKNRASSGFCDYIFKEYKDTADSHYYGINYSNAYRKHQTIEVRIHEGTINVREIRMWVRFLTHLVNMDTTLTQPQKNFQYIHLPNEVRLYLNGRIKKFA